MTSDGRYRLAIRQPILESRSESVDGFLKDVLSRNDGNPTTDSRFRLVLHTSTDPVAAGQLRRVFRDRRRQLRDEGIGYFDNMQLQKMDRYERWISHLGPSDDVEAAFQESLRAGTDERMQKLERQATRRQLMMIASSDVFFGHQLRKSDDIGAPLPTSMRTLRSVVEALGPAEVEAVIHRYSPGLSFAGMYQTYAEAGGTADPGAAAGLWLGRGDLDVERWKEHLHETVGIRSVRILDCPAGNSVSDGIAVLETVDIRLRRAMLPLDDEHRSLGRRRLSLRGSQILARINRSEPSKLQVKKAQKWVMSEFSGSATAISAETTRFIAGL